MTAQAGRRKGAGMLSSESPQQLLVKEEGKRGEYCQGRGAGGSDKGTGFTMSTTQTFPSELSADVLQLGHS